LELLHSFKRTGSVLELHLLDGKLLAFLGSTLSLLKIEEKND